MAWSTGASIAGCMLMFKWLMVFMRSWICIGEKEENGVPIL